MAEETFVVKPAPSIYKIVLLGDARVGKSCLAQRYVKGSFSESYKATVGMDFNEKKVPLPHLVEVKLQIWDIAGQERYRNMTSAYLRNTEAVCVVYDVTKLSSFQNLRYHIKTQVKDLDTIIFIIGNKIEMETERQVTFDEGKTFADEMGYEFKEVSAAKDLGVDNLFMSVMKAVYRKKNPGSLTGLSCSAKTFFKK